MTVVCPRPFPVLIEMAQPEQVGDNEFLDEVGQVGPFRKSTTFLLLDAEASRPRAGIAVQIAMILNSIFRSDGCCSSPGFEKRWHRVGVVRGRDDANLKCVPPFFAVIYGVKVEDPFRDTVFHRSKARIALLYLGYLFGREDRHLLVSARPRPRRILNDRRPRDDRGSRNGLLRLFLDDFVLVYVLARLDRFF